MSECTHPTSAHHFDRARGIVTCSICGDVVADQQFEMDPAFSRGERGGGGGAMRQGGGFARPLRTTQLHMPASQRPSIEVARRGMLGIARQLEIPGDDVEIAAGIFKMAVTTNAIGGARPAVLAACLYIVCRRNHSPHTVLDFADATKQSPYNIISYMKTIAAATHTNLPTIDASYHLARFATQLNLGDLTDDIALLALKILRAMKDDWIQEGRRPLGPCAAALIVACQAYGFSRSLEAVAGMVRLSASTIELRLTEFSSTSAAQLQNIDEYVPTDTANPRAYEKGRVHDADYTHDNEVRDLAQVYYELVEEAKLSTEANEERCQKWRTFFEGHCKIQNMPPPDESKLDLANITPSDQLKILGLPNTEPLTQEEIEAANNADIEIVEYEKDRTYTQQNAAGDAAGNGAVTEEAQAQFNQLMHATEIEGLGDIDMGLDFSDDPLAPRPTEPTAAAGGDLGSDDPFMTAVAGGFDDPFSMDAKDGMGEEGAPGAGDEANPNAPAAMPESLEEVNDLYFAPQSGWEIIILDYGDGGNDNDEDLDGYIVYDEEERIRHNKLNTDFHKDHWNRGAPKSLEELKRLRWNKVSGKKRKRIGEDGTEASAAVAVQNALRGKGAGQLDLENLDYLIPGGDGEDGGANAEDAGGDAFADGADVGGGGDDWAM